MTINLNGKLMDLSLPKVMGILNVTPDSFYDGGKFSSDKKVLDQVEKMILDGADIIDIGGYSSKPGAKEVKTKEEINRVIPTIELIKNKFSDIILSIDTFRSRVAQKAVQSGASLINDISAGELDSNMFKCVAELKVPYILMHMQGNPQNMQKNPSYKNVINEIVTDLSKKIFLARKAGIIDIIADPGFGFGKTQEHNFELLKNLSLFKNLEVPILVGVSRKSMLYKTLGISAQEALNATTSANTIALLNGASILRVHDVKEAVEAVKIVAEIR